MLLLRNISQKYQRDFCDTPLDNRCAEISGTLNVHRLNTHRHISYFSCHFSLNPYNINVGLFIFIKLIIREGNVFSGIIQKVLEVDRYIFYLINVKLQNPLFNIIMPFITDFNNFGIPIIIIFISLMMWGRKKEKMVLISACFTLLLSSQMSSYYLKPFFGRVRPFEALSGIRLLVGSTNSYSFPSTHTANVIAVATFLSLKYRRMLIPSFVIAIAIAYSRIYVGVHYPLDVIAGASVGFICALLVFFFEKAVFKIHVQRLRTRYEVKDGIRRNKQKD